MFSCTYVHTLMLKDQYHGTPVGSRTIHSTHVSTASFRLYNALVLPWQPPLFSIYIPLGVLSWSSLASKRLPHEFTWGYMGSHQAFWGHMRSSKLLWGHKRPFNVRCTYKMSQGKKVPRDKMSQGQNVPRDKTSQWTKLPTLITKFSKTNFVLENWPHMLGNGPQFMIGVFLFWKVRLGNSFILAIFDKLIGRICTICTVQYVR